METLEKMHERICGHHLNFYQNGDVDASIEPMIMAVCENGDIVPVIGRFENDLEKQMFIDVVTEMFKKWKVVRYSFAFEAWVAVYEANAKNIFETPTTMPSERDDRKEVVFTFSKDINGKQLSDCRELIRDWSSGKVIELKNYDVGSKEMIAGRFTTLL